MFEQYKSEVLSDYLRKKNELKLSLNLINPAPARLRDECLKVYIERYSPEVEDEEAIKLFFGSKSDSNDYVKIIRTFDPDKFRPLVNFLKGSTTDPENKNVELLAWLIDFKERPFGKKKFKKPDGQKPDMDGRKSTKPLRKILITATSIAMVLVAGIYFYTGKGKKVESGINTEEATPMVMLTSNPSEKPVSKSYIASDKQCMYWTGEYYKPISCNATIAGDTPIVALDRKKASRLRRITRPDTLDKKDLSTTWYVKVNVDSIEFYTDSGSYPLDTKKRLRPLTTHMLNKYPNGYNIYKRKDLN